MKPKTNPLLRDCRRLWRRLRRHHACIHHVQRGKRVVIPILLVAVLLSVVGVLGYYLYSMRSRKGGINSLAVLPFANTSKDPEKEYLSDGISESLINRLSQLPGVKIIANTSSSRYKGQDTDLKEVARVLNVDAVLTGRILQRGNDLLINVELVNGLDRTQVWGSQYNRKATDLVAVQAEISREITNTLRPRLTEGKEQDVTKNDRVKPAAYELLLKGRFYHSKGNAESRLKAIEYFNQALAVDPTCAPAYAELSNTYRALVSYSLLDPKESLPKAEAAAQKALELDDGLADAHYAVANLKAYRWEREEAERYYRRAIELNPN